MFSHVMVGCNSPEEGRAFYDATLGALGISGQPTPSGAFYNDGAGGMFGVGAPRDGAPATHANGGTIGFRAKDPAAVDAWHAAALANGGTCEGPPGRRDYGPQPMYGAYARDAVGNKLCAFTTNVEG
jgi:catechol 2,3-dioxygenase-like lactoylglutathione lyase family enzyme